MSGPGRKPIRFERFGDHADLDAAIDARRRAASQESAPPRVRATAARGWGYTAARGQRWPEAVAGFSAAAELLELMAPRSLSRSDQEYLLAQQGGLGADAASCCVHAGLTDQAVELFEQGRGVLLGQALDTRTSVASLAEQHPAMAARFSVLRDICDPASPSAERDPVIDVTAGARAGIARQDTHRRAAATAFHQVIAEIRELHGFHRFLQPPTAAELTEAAAEGPVAAVAVSPFGSHALILTSSGVLDPLPLPELTPQAVYEQVDAFLDVLSSSGDREAAEQRLCDMLGWLWDAVAGPVLDQAGITGPPQDGQPWPRLFWCVSGLLSFLPLHAAGHHQPQAAAPATVIDRVISSYTPTLRSLIHTRRSRPRTTSDGCVRPGAEDQVVAVAMPWTPGHSPLPYAQAEAAELQRQFPGQVTVLTGAQATHHEVLAALPAARWVHFACHADSKISDPSASRLLLTDHWQRSLTVTDIARLRVNDGQLAFLSACSTGRPGDQLADEAIHLASAFQLAGYQHVIATLWPIEDQSAAELAASIYANLTSTSGGHVATAVHTAVRQIRQKNGWATPSVWASHIHVGT